MAAFTKYLIPRKANEKRTKILIWSAPDISSDTFPAYAISPEFVNIPTKEIKSRIKNQVPISAALSGIGLRVNRNNFSLSTWISRQLVIKEQVV